MAHALIYFKVALAVDAEDWRCVGEKDKVRAEEALKNAALGIIAPQLQLDVDTDWGDEGVEVNHHIHHVIDHACDADVETSRDGKY